MPVPTHIFDPPFNIIRCSHLVLDVTDLNASAAFYEGATLTVTGAAGDTLISERAAERENSYARQLEHLVAVLRSGEPSILDAERAVGTMGVVDDIYRAAGLQPR